MQKETSIKKRQRRLVTGDNDEDIEICDTSQNITSPKLYTEELMGRFGSAIAMVGYTDRAPSEQNLFVCGSGFVLEGQFLITAVTVHDALSWRENTDIFAATIIEGGSVRYIPITFIDSDLERGIAVYRLSTVLPQIIKFADIDFTENELVTGVNALTLSYCTANESLCCHRTPILMSNQIYIRKGQDYGNTFPLKADGRTYAIVQGLVQEQECGAPIVLPLSRWGPQTHKIIGIIGGSLESMYRDFVIIEEKNQLHTAWSFAGFTNSSLYTHMNEEIKSNASLINDAALVSYQNGNNEGGTGGKSLGDNDTDSFDEDLDAFMDEFDDEEDTPLATDLD